MSFPSSSSSQFSSLPIFDDQTAEAAAALLQIRGSPRTPNVPFIPEFSHPFISASPISASHSHLSRLNPLPYDSRYYLPVQTNGVSNPNPGFSSGSKPSSSIDFQPSSVPIINVPSPQRKRKRSLVSESTRSDSQPPTNKGKAVDHTSLNEPPEKTKSVLENDGVMRCICELQVDDGFTIQCESCQVWQHAACMRIHPKTVPRVYLCEQCNPRMVDGVRARRALLSRLQAKNAQKQAQEKKKRRTSSDIASKQKKGTASTSPQPQPQPQQHPQQPTSQRQFSTSFTSPTQPYTFLQFDSQSQNPYPSSTKDEILSPTTPFVPITDSSSSTPSTFYHSLPTRPSRDALHVLWPRVDHSQLDQCQLCDEPNMKCDHTTPPTVTLHSANIQSGEFNEDSPNVVLRPRLCGNRSNSVASQPEENVTQNNQTSHTTFGIFALRDIKAGEEIVLGCEWDAKNTSGDRRRSTFATLSGVHEGSVSSILSKFLICACGSLSESCLPLWSHQRLSDTLRSSNGFYDSKTTHNQEEGDPDMLLPTKQSQDIRASPPSRAKKKPRTATVKGSRKATSGSTRKRKGSTANGKRTTANKKGTKDMDIDQDVDIDTKSEDLDVGPSSDSATNALATLSLQGAPENTEQDEKHTPGRMNISIVETVSRFSNDQEQILESNNAATVTNAKGPRARASSVANPTVLEPVANHSPRSSAIKPISAVVLAPLLPSSTANANPVVHAIDPAAAGSIDIPVVPSLPSVAKDPPEVTRPPIKRLSLADWKIGKDKEKRALREAREKAVQEPTTEPTLARLDVPNNIDTIVERLSEDLHPVERQHSPDISLLSASSRSPLRDIDIDEDKPMVGTTSLTSEPGMVTLMEQGVMKLRVEAGDDYNSTEARPFTSPQVPSCSLHADSSSDAQHTPLPPCPPSSSVGDDGDGHSPFEAAFEEGEIKSSSSPPPPPSREMQDSPRAPPCPTSQPPHPQSQQASYRSRSRSISPSCSPPAHPRSPRSYHSHYHSHPHQRAPPLPPPPPRSVSPFSSSSQSHSRSVPSDGQSQFRNNSSTSRPVPSAPRALRGGVLPRHLSSPSQTSFSSSYRPNSHREYDRDRDRDRYRGPASSFSSSRFHDSPLQRDNNNNKRPWLDPPWKR